MSKSTAAKVRVEPAISRATLPVKADALARFLIGKLLVRRLQRTLIVGRIVETEAYVADDPAGHGFIGETARNQVLFGERGHAYVYRIYGLHWCLNVSAGAKGEGVGVLLRAVQPIAGIAAMHRLRGVEGIRNLARGPGRLAQAFAIDHSLNDTDLTRAGALWLATAPTVRHIGQSVRIGITKAADKPLRYYERGNPFVSGPAALNT